MGWQASNWPKLPYGERFLNDFLVISQHALLMLWTQFELAEFVSTPKMNCVLRRSSNSSMLDSRSWPGGTRRCRTTHLMKHMIITGSHALLFAVAQAHGWVMLWPPARAQAAQETTSRSGRSAVTPWAQSKCSRYKVIAGMGVTLYEKF